MNDDFLNSVLERGLVLKSFEKKTEVSVKRFNVIIGKNSAGKSTYQKLLNISQLSIAQAIHL